MNGTRGATVLYCSTATVARWKDRFEAGGPCGVWVAAGVRWVLKLSPVAFGPTRSRWCCEARVLVLWEQRHVRVSRETVRRWIADEQIVWRRPRPVLGPADPQRSRKLAELRDFLAKLPPDEADVNTNPKIGPLWMRKGRQAEVMNFPGVVGGDPELLAKLAALAGRPTGTPRGVSGRRLNAYAAARVGSDHECVTPAEAREKLGRGLRLLSREATNARKLDALLPVVTPANSRRVCFCTDDRTPVELLERGSGDGGRVAGPVKKS